MTSRELVLRALEFRFPDRAPRNLWPLEWVNIFCPEELAAVQRDFPDDFLAPNNVMAPGDRCKGKPYRKGTYVDEWGSVWHCAEDGVLGEVKTPALADFSALDTFQPPWEVIRKANWDAANRLARKNESAENKFLFALTSVHPFEALQFLRGTEQLLMDLAYGQTQIQRLMEMVHEYNIETIKGWAKTDVDAIAFNDDWGSQQALLISPQMWRQLFKPMYKDYCDLIHSSGKKTFFHSDGNIMAIYEDLIEIGVDAVNSQLFCMDIDEIAQRFKGRITFWGEIDRQHVLPFGTVEEVRQAVRRVRRALDDPAGGVIAQCEWGPQNPSQNIRAVFDAWKQPLANPNSD